MKEGREFRRNMAVFPIQQCYEVTISGVRFVIESELIKPDREARGTVACIR